MLTALLQRILLSFRKILCVLALLFASISSLHSQAPETLRIPLRSAVATQSSITLFQNALYNIVVRGRGSVGQVINAQTEVDARFFVNNLPFQMIQRPQMPLDANGTAAEQFCTTFAANPAASPCLVFLAWNALRPNPALPATQSNQFAVQNAQQLRRFAFIPDRQNDAYDPNNAYFATVQGGNLPLQTVFVDRLGFGNNASYNDNSDTLTMRVERISPELAISARPSFAVNSVQPARILNDDRPRQPFRDMVLDFGSYRVGSPQQTRRFVIYNRGTEPLTVRFDVDTDPNSFFLISSPVGDVRVQRIINRGDSLPIFLSYQPRVQAAHTLDVQIFTNDPTFAASAGGTEIFRLRLQGAGVGGSLNVTGLDAANTLVFNTLRAEAPTRDFRFDVRSFTFSRASDVRTNFWIDSAVRTPGSPFVSNSPDVLTVLPSEIEATSGAMFNPTIVFRPIRFGDFLDSITLRGRNLDDYTLYLRGRAELADATIERLQAPVDGEMLDFGTVVTGQTTTQTVVVRNAGNLPLTMANSLETSIGGASRDASEFTLLQPTGNLDSTTGGTFLATVRYTAETSFPSGRKEATLTVRVRNPATGTEIATRPFILRVNRLPNILAPARQTLGFDSVYVGSERRDTTLLRNISPTFSATLQAQPSIDALTSSRAFSAEAIDTARTARRYSVGASGQLAATFRPRTRGADSANYILTSLIDSTQGRETLALRLRGVGVEQQFDVVSATSDAMSNSQIQRPVASFAQNGYRKFTIDLGCVRVGLTRDVRIAFQNNGNLPFAVWRQDRILSGNTSNDAAFTVLRQFITNSAVTAGGRDSSLTVQFRPTDLGVKTFQYILFSDIKRAGRIPTAPDSVEQIILELRAEGIRPNITTPLRVEFPRNSLGTGCPVNSTIPIVIENPPNRANCGTPLTYRAELVRGGGLFQLSINPTTGTIQAGEQMTILATFRPLSVGVFTDTLRITSDAIDSVRRIVLVGEAIGQPTITVSAATVQASPGETVSIPVFVRPSPSGDIALNQTALSYAQRATFDFTYNRTLLQYTGFEANRTASANANILPPARLLSFNDDSTLRFTITAREPQLIPANEILLWLNFRAYLGRRVSATPLRLTNVRFDNIGDSGGCVRVRVLESATTTGTFALDSVCGVQAKVSAVGNGTFLLSEIAPNPVTDNMRVDFEVAYPSLVTVEILDALGQVKATVTEGFFPEGAYQGEVSTAHLAPGVYFCRMKAERFTTMRKILLVR
ncbi:MAG: choice-of-anchor D domain-containing protein [Candidatus Kapabacteria bacterium]|jgi:hypothetical protein|nr:choice-of-anchor D domain-containing protein [Candidatus Kapabacteria bacterium]